MSSQSSKYLTVRPEDYFIGASQSASTTLSVLKSLLETTGTFFPVGTTTVAFHQRVAGAQLVHFLKVEPQDEGTLPSDAVWRRFLCHALLSTLPAEAIVEVEDRLTEIYDDFMPQGRPQSGGQVSAPRLFLAQQGQHHPRPGIEIED